MNIVGDRRFIEIPGGRTHELPPLLVKTSPEVNRLDKVVDMASRLIDEEDMIPDNPLDALANEAERNRRKMDLALNLTDQYLRFVAAWQWGDGVLEWIRQCEITFENRADLRTLLRADLWPHASRASFVQLLHDKGVEKQKEPTRTVPPCAIENSVGLRLTFRQPPPMRCFSDQFLLYLNSPVAESAYQAWAHTSPAEPSLPPERFTFQVISMSLA
ncbi:hypothetical protein F183_A14640 [Bryobacterales bacterium F-183]|nr:hypothetical protein F183_A14640 [Bryobacterales bacterium F-183]